MEIKLKWLVVRGIYIFLNEFHALFAIAQQPSVGKGFLIIENS
jgi:hypothetical protein